VDDSSQLGEVEDHERIIGELDPPPSLMGHSSGGLVVQIFLDHGPGAVGVAIDSGAPKDVRTLPPAQASERPFGLASSARPEAPPPTSPMSRQVSSVAPRGAAGAPPGVP
jgi:pimeloyl-ACP methyl ester carboxylesterase